MGKGERRRKEVLHFHRRRTCKIEEEGRIKQQRERSEAMPPTLLFSPCLGPRGLARAHAFKGELI